MKWLEKINWYKTTAISIAVVLVLLVVFFLFSSTPIFETKFTIEEGQSLSSVAQELKSEDLVKSKMLFILYVLAAGEDKNLQAGEYLLSGKLSIREIVRMFAEGRYESRDTIVIIPEGFNIFEIDKRFVEAGLVEREGDFARRWYKDEGYLFPDTYRFDPDKDDIETIGKRMKDTFWSKVGDVDEEIIIIASLLEKEARTRGDMKLVSGIIRSRLSLDMLLQIDAAVAYGACLRDAIKVNFLKLCNVQDVGIAKELKIDNPYNIYMWPGIPPAPIANPGLKAITAAANPMDSPYLFYLSPRDGSTIIYSKTGAEHAVNRKKYLGI